MSAIVESMNFGRVSKLFQLVPTCSNFSQLVHIFPYHLAADKYLGKFLSCFLLFLLALFVVLWLFPRIIFGRRKLAAMRYQRFLARFVDPAGHVAAPAAPTAQAAPAGGAAGAVGAAGAGGGAGGARSQVSD